MHESINPSIHESINPSIHESINPSIHRFMPLNQSVIHQSVNPSIHQFMNLNHSIIHQSVNQSTNASPRHRVGSLQFSIHSQVGVQLCEELLASRSRCAAELEEGPGGFPKRESTAKSWSPSSKLPNLEDLGGEPQSKEEMKVSDDPNQ